MPRTTDAPTDADLDRLIDGARVSWGRAGDHYPARLDGFSYQAAVREADDAHETIGDLVGALVALRAALAATEERRAVAEGEYEAYFAECLELRAIVAGGAETIARLESALAEARPVVAAAREVLAAATPPGAHWLGGTLTLCGEE